MSFDRRRFLRQAGLGTGATLLAAIGGRLATTVAAPDKMDRITFVNVHSNAWWNKLIRPVNRQSETEWEFSPSLEPLERFRERTIHLENFNNFNGLHGAYGAMLSVVAGAKGTSSTPRGITIDRHIAKAKADGVPFDSVNLGHTYGHGNLSADGPNQVYPSLRDPGDIIDRLFANNTGAAVDPTAERRAQVRSSLLDIMSEDIARAQTRLAGTEKASMEQYLTSVRELEERFAQLGVVTCERPVYDGPTGGGGNSRMVPERSHFLYEAASTALICGLTRVVSIAHEGCGGQPLQPTYPFDPVNLNESLHNPTQHPMNGLNNNDNEASDRAWAGSNRIEPLTRLYRWRSQQVSDMFARLEAVDLGGTTLADRTLMLWTNVGGGKHHRGSDEFPALIIGNPDGVLNSGRYQRFDIGDRSLADVYTTFAHAAGVPTDSFGTANRNKGPLPGLLA